MASSQRVSLLLDDVDEIDRPSYFHQKTIFTILFNGTREYKIAILPEGQKMNNPNFRECVLHPVTDFCDPQGRGTYERRAVLHFDSASIRNTEEFKKVWRILDSEEWSISLL
jgi:hypothetical protein